MVEYVITWCYGYVRQFYAILDLIEFRFTHGWIYRTNTEFDVQEGAKNMKFRCPPPAYNTVNKDFSLFSTLSGRVGFNDAE